MNKHRHISSADAQLETTTIVDVFERVVQADPSARAVIFGTQTMDYGTLNERADALAERLVSEGIGPGDLVGISSDRALELMVAVMGTLKAGAGYLPLDVSLPKERLVFMAQNTGIRVLLGSCPPLDDEPMVRIAYKDFPKTAKNPPKAKIDGENIAYVMYTSGTTGNPKGVMLPHRSVIRLLVGTDWLELGPETISLHSSAFAFDTSIIDIFGPLLNGGAIVLPPNGMLALSVIAEQIVEHKVTMLWLTTGLFNAMADTHASCFENVHELIIGGDIVSPVQVAKVLAVCPNLRAINGYGPTESNVTNWHLISYEEASSGNPLPIGKSVRGSQTYVVDDKQNLVPHGTRGELALAGRGLALGYWGRKDLTDEKFVQAPWDKDLMIYLSGDVAMDPGNGSIEFFGRVDNQVKIRGFRVELGEVEATLEQFGAVTQAAVIAKESSDLADKTLIGFYVGDNVDPDEVHKFLAEKLPVYARPQRLHEVEALPVTPNGKVDKRALLDVDQDVMDKKLNASSGASSKAAPKAKAAPKPAPAAAKPATAAKPAIVAVVEDVLEIQAPDTKANFFDLGASSLQVARIHDGVQKALDTKFPITDFFLHTTIEALATHLSVDKAAATPKATETRKDVSTDAIAIVGMAGRFPGAPDVNTFWENIVAGRETISHFTPEELDVNPNDHDPDAPYVAARGVMEGADMFDARHFGIPPREAEKLDPQHRVLLEVAQNALDSSGHDPARFDGRIGIFCGAALNSYLLNNLVSGPGKAREIAIGYPVRDLATVFGNDKDFLATRLAYKLNLTGPAVNIQCACSTSLVAVAQACDALKAGHADMALAGGVAITFPQKRPYLYTPEGMAAEDGHCRAFDADSSGTVFGDGAGLVVLRRLSDALEAGDNVIAVINGYAVNNDGSEKAGYAAPSIKAQAEVIEAAHSAAGINARQINYVEAHGTGTPLGDPIEFAALHSAFSASTDATGFCALGSVKTNVGHLDTASGITGLIKAALTIANEEIPPLVNFNAPNPRIDFENSAFYPVATNKPWPRGLEPRYAGVTSLGVGGTNIHMVITESPAPSAKPAQQTPLEGPQVYPVTASKPCATDARNSPNAAWSWPPACRIWRNAQAMHPPKAWLINRAKPLPLCFRAKAWPKCCKTRPSRSLLFLQFPMLWRSNGPIGVSLQM